ncbi:MAG: DUF1295 domain-containing protein [Antricoccus sp.]
MAAAIGHRIGRVNVIDVAWGVMFVAAAIVAAILGTASSSRRWIILGIVAVWGLRLSIYLALKTAGHGEDPRYERILRKGDGSFLYTVRKVYLLQAFLAWFISLPVQVAAITDRPIGPLMWIGAVIAVVGIALETVGDAQLSAFKSDPANKGKIMSSGLWSWTRHPNYFGDACLWWGVFLISAEAWPGALTILSPVAMTYLLVFLSGAKLLERSMSKRPGYNRYMRQTSFFVPLPPKKMKSG